MDMALSFPASNSSLYPFLLQTQNSFPSKASKFVTTCFTCRSIQVNAVRNKRKPRPSFFEQICDKWSLKVPSTRERFPWEEQKQMQKKEEEEEEEEEEDTERSQTSGMVSSKAENDSSSSASDDPVSFSVPNRLNTAPWIHGTNPRTTHISSHCKHGENVDRILDHREENAVYAAVDKAESLKKEVNYNNVSEEKDSVLYADDAESFEQAVNYDAKFSEEEVKLGAVSVHLTRDEEIARVRESKDTVSLNDKPYGGGSRGHGSIVVSHGGNSSSIALSYHNDNNSSIELPSHNDNSNSIELPWEREKKVEPVEGDWRMKKSNTELAERILPEHELKRLRNVALRMFERIKVGAAGITQDLVDTIHGKWRLDEVVKLKFEGPPSCNMKRTHEILESRTRGLVIWRSGSSVVLYRGMSYTLQCVQSFSKQSEASKDITSHPEEVTSNVASNAGVRDLIRTAEPFIPDYAKYLKYLSQEELTDFSELNQLLDDLGPRFNDWCGREPLPVDADLLPALDPEYKAPFRLLPYGVRPCLTNKEMTSFRRLARIMPPQFALGRNRQLQGLAKAMIKLWERSAIAKIAIKRGVQNTRNERMAEELKVLTGGTLLSRNKEYIVFYRGNDFLPPAIMETLKERKKLTYLNQDEEEQARQMALSFVESNGKTSQDPPLVAGTLTETVAATSRWRNHISGEYADEMMREASLARRASLIRHLKGKLGLAKVKLHKAEKALAKVQEHLEPSGLPTDLETVSDEERFLFRKIGLSMKPYLLLGRRGVYDGTIENMHLHWKYRELVKIIVSGRKNFAQVRHIAISLEAESGGILVSVEKTTKGYAIIVYRGKNYLRPHVMRPSNLLTKRQALARSIELQRREALKHHISDLEERIELLKFEFEEMKSSKKIDVENTFSLSSGDASFSDSDIKEEGEEPYLEVYGSNEDTNDQN